MIPTTVLRTARHGFSLPRGSVRLLSTRFGKVCLAHRAHDGAHTQLRLTRDAADTASRLATEQAWLTHLARGHGLAVPAPLSWHTGDALPPPIRARDGSVWRATAYEWVAGRHLIGGLDAAAMRRAGALLARMHRANVDAPDGIAAQRPVWWIPRLFELATSLRDIVLGSGALPAGVTSGLARSLQRAHDALVAAYDGLDGGPSAAGLIHTDAHAQNLRFTQRRVGIVDFEDFASGRFMLDVACLWGEVENRPHAARLLDAILDGYDGVTPLPDAHLRDLNVMLAFRRFDYAGWVLSWPRPDLRSWGPAFLHGAARYIDRHLAHA